ncbi:SspB-related isopeptide-forming adhesin [Ligilactobacillus salivarius]|uniref:SspB-related isopeptide-forming adhesin n=1 Tax=Ligilactobacillus salivarius TaxID=1624 RepID=UPI00210357CB|nr:SspB-related isopeptide-forming adhesin [Ligilactobacillus salivarius]UTX37559.1 LPXTG cell wall anchor domain-containing protein [Ligilactobacillus salivarius]
MTETKLHYKLYKTKHGWVTATIAATALAIPVIGGSVTSHASADTTGTQTVTSGSNAVTATTASATSVTSSTQSVTPDSSKLDQAVQNAKATANVTVNQTPTQTVTGSTVAEAKQKAEQDYQNQATQINQKVANQKANNDATNAANSFNMDNSKKRELDQAVQNAKSTANVNVKQTQTQIYNTGVSGVENTKNKINNDYSTQINNINQAVSTQKAKNDAYNKAVAEANTLNSTADTTRKKLDDAIKAAQAVKGVTVIDGGTTTATVSVSDFEAKKKQIQDQNTQQTNDINAQIQQYKDTYANWKKDNQKFLEAAAAKTGWSVQQVLDFLGKDLPNVSYISAGANMTFDKGTLQSFNQNELNSILSNPKVDPGLKGYIASKAYGNLYKLSQGVTWRYNNAFTDTKSGKSVDLKVTVQGLGLNYSGRYGLPPMIMVGEKYIGSDVTGIGAVRYGLTFLEHGTNTPINLTSLIGVGDVDAAQSVAVYDAVSALRGSKNKNYSGTGYLGSINTNGVDDFSEGKNTQYQSWFLVPNSSTVSYVFSAADPAWGNGAPDGSGFMGFYHQNLGGIPLPIKSTPPTPPTIHYHHTNVALEKPTPTEVTYHYDTIMPATIPGGTPVSYHYNEISVPIPNPTKKADKEGKTLIAGDESTQHISQYTGVNQKLDKFAVGDAIQYTNDGRLPVSFDLSKWTVTTSNGTNVTAQGKFTQYDKTFEGKKYHVVSWSPTNVSSLKDNETYTLNTVLKTLNDGITDGEIDRAVGGGDGVTFGEAHGYDEFNPTTDKAWKEGSQTVNGKIEINEDIAHAKVTMTMPDPAKLANKLSNVAITDNYSKFANLVTVTGANVYENERNATSDYTIVNNNKVVTATRKNPATANGGTVSLVVDFKVNPDVPSGTKLVNSGSGTINTQTVPTPDAQIVTFTQTSTKHWVEGSQVVDGKTYINDDIVTTKVDMDLPEPSQLAKTLSYVSVTDDYRDFKDKAVLQSYKVLENGTDVTSQYTVTNNAGLLQAVRKNAATTPGGKVSLIATFEVNHDVKSGTTFTNRGSGRINNHTVDTNTPQIVTFKQDTSKHWVEGSQVVDDKTYINEDMVHGQVTMTLPNRDSLAKALTDVTLVDDYSDYANKVSYVNAQVFENGTDVTSQYTITNAGNKITATRKNPGATPSGSVRLVANFKLNSNLPSGTKLINRGSGRINNNTVNTNEAKILTYVQSTDKHWVEGSQKVDGKTYIDGDTIHGQVTMSLPDKNTLAKALSTVQVIDDYSKFAKLVDYKSAQVLENGKDVTSQYNISNAYGQVVATRKDAAATPSGNVTLNVTWTIHKDVPSGTQLINSGSGRINDHTVPTPNRNIVTYKQDTLKNWINSQGQIVNDKTVIDRDIVHGQVEMTLPDPTKLANKLSKVEVVDDYSNFADKVIYTSARVLENGKDVTSLYTITNANGRVTATRKDPSATPGGKVVLIANLQVHSDVKSGTELVNKGYGTLNTETIETNTPKIVTFRQDTDKHWVEGSQVVDGKTYIDGDNVSAQISMTLPDPKQLAEKLKNVVIVDDYSKFADKVDYKSAKVLENGKDVTSDYDIKVSKQGFVIASRKDPSTTPAGKVVLQAFWKVHNDIESNTQLVNSGLGQINDETVPTPDRTIVTYKQDTEKHWRDDGGQIVDGKIAINDDVVTARVDMTLPKEENLAKPLDKIQLVDDFSKFADKVILQDVHVYETGKDGVRRDVTDQYDIHVENGRVVATRKDASKVYDHTGVANATMKATLKANKALNVNDLVHTASANVNDSKVSTVNRLAFTRLFARSFITSNLAVTSDNNIKSQIDMAVPTNVDAKTPMTVTSDYSNFAKYVNVKDATVYENGKNVTADYTIKDDKAGHVTATKKAGSESDGGQVSLVVDYEVNHGIPSGTILENHGSGTLNGQDVPTNTPSITTYTQDTNKHWVEGDQNVDGKIYVNGSTAHAQVSMTLPDQSKLINKLSNVSIDDDYSKFAKLVDYKSAKVLENGKDVTSEYTIKNANGHVTAVRKDASKTPAGNVQLLVDFEIHKDVKSGTELVNGGSGTLNKNTVPTNTPSIWTYTPDGEKHWVLDNNVTDNKIYFSGDKAVAQVSVDLPDASKLATPLNKLVLVDNYSDFADKVKLDSAKVLENGKDVTAEYDLSNKDGKVIATRKDAAKTPSGKAVLVTTFTINNGIENATALHNKGSVTVDSITDEVPDTPIVVFTPKAHKDVELGGDVKGDTENSVDGSLILNGSVVTYPITTSDLPAERAEDITKRVVKDTLDKNAEFVGFKAWIENDKGELEDVTSHYKLDKNGQDLTFTEDSHLLGLYNKDKSKQTHTPIIDLVVKVKGDAQKITNKATVLTNDNVTETNTVTVDTPAKPKPTKVDKNEKGVNIDGKNVLPGSVNNYELTMDLAKFKGIKVTNQDLAKGFYFVDDYPEEALDVDPQTFTYKTVDGKTVKGLSAKVYQSLSEVPENVAAVLKANGITPNGAFVLISADDPTQFFKDYVETGTNITVNAPMKVKEGFAGKYQNKAWQLTFGQGEATDIVSNNVPKIDPKKDIVISADNRTSLNNHTIELGQNFDYLLKGGILDKDQGHDIYEYKWVDDYDENHDQYNGQFIAPLTVNVTLKDGTVLKAGTDISNHVSQNIDTKTGSVEFSVDKDFLDKVDFDKSGFAADILMSVKRIKAGEVDNTYTNIINGQKFGSNTVHSTTPEPKEPETPATPKTPETPSVPVAQTQTPATPQPVKMVTSTPAPKTPELPALPQTGEANDTLAEEVVGFAAIVAALGMAGTSLKKRED